MRNILLIALLGFASCDKDKTGCWECKTTYHDVRGDQIGFKIDKGCNELAKPIEGRVFERIGAGMVLNEVKCSK